VVGFCVVGEQDKEKKMIPSNFYPKVRLLAIVGGLALAACVLGFMATHKPADAAFPGGKGKIAFHSRHISGLQDSEIYTITADGKIIKRLTNNVHDDEDATFSPDGRRIAFRSVRLGVPDIFTMKPSGARDTNVTKNALNEGSPAWSPDGTQITFVRSGDIYVINANGTNERRLTEDPEIDFDPAWSPDGSKILFSRTCDAAFPCFGRDLWVMNANGNDERRFFTDPDAEDCTKYQPDWSPDGTKVVFAHACLTDASKNGIYVVNADGSGQKRLTTFDEPQPIGPVWSPNGRKVAFTRDVDGVSDLHVMRADGTNITNITNTPLADELFPSWQPVKAPSG
jgi:Tol biopolymer transport system component